MADYPDVLDSMGKTPREFGALHVHLESLKPVDANRYVVTVLLQAAFEPMPRAQLSFVSEGEVLSTVEVPSLKNGRVVRLHVPIEPELPLSRIGLDTSCDEPSRSAERVRPAWKLHDTFEIPTTSSIRRAFCRRRCSVRSSAR